MLQPLNTKNETHPQPGTKLSWSDLKSAYSDVCHYRSHGEWPGDGNIPSWFWATAANLPEFREVNVCDLVTREYAEKAVAMIDGYEKAFG